MRGVLELSLLAIAAAVSIWVGMVLIYRFAMSKASADPEPANWYCSECGSGMPAGRFCGVCGTHAQGVAE